MAYHLVEAAMRNDPTLEEVTEADKLGIDDRYEGIIPLEKMARLIEEHPRRALRLDEPGRRNRRDDKVLRFMDHHLLDDCIINELMASPGMRVGRRELIPAALGALDAVSLSDTTLPGVAL